ncbi:MAG: hypothetical protein M1823_002060 [Watsoniomyces obsoletus]|nr:MAG: hypothetical protein M1823_002060 [Watsoniomyces obsoletus]
MEKTEQEGELVLKDLCLICHVSPPRYRCPRCALRTCSLVCSQRHKRRAQCSGVRDPAAYVKRSDLATPAGIDRDFNFLVGVERHLDRAEQDILQRKLPPLEHVGPAKGARPGRPKAEGPLSSSIRRAGVTVEHAPKGLQRERENRTRWHQQQQCLSWTVEWIDDTSRRSLVSAFDTLTVREAYERVSLQESQRPRKRRKAEAMKVVPTEDVERSITDESTQAERSERASNASPDMHFYLLRPRTAGPDRVLIPVPSTTKLSDALRHRVVLEFPTFYVLPHPPHSLPAGFVSEAQPSNGFIPEPAEGVAISKNRSTSPSEESSQAADPPDEDKSAPSVPATDVQHILRMLAQDVGSS